jgi:glycosyltransferase involved in cell wall biosynthesis
VKFSIITPSLNQATFLGDAIGSVHQNRRTLLGLEYILMDGVSADASLDIIRAKAAAIDHWESGPDNGQSHAINKGLKFATGDIFGWLNSDDLLMPDALSTVAGYFGEETFWVTGACEIMNEQGVVVKQVEPELPPSAWHWQRMLANGYSYTLLQPSTFWRKEVHEAIGWLREDLHYSFDHEFFYRMYKQFGPPTVVPKVLSRFRIHDQSKTGRSDNKFKKENFRIAFDHLKDVPLYLRPYLLAVLGRSWLRYG